MSFDRAGATAVPEASTLIPFEITLMNAVECLSVRLKACSVLYGESREYLRVDRVAENLDQTLRVFPQKLALARRSTVSLADSA